MGEMVGKVMLEDGPTGKVKFQAAKIRKPLLAVSGVVDKGNLVIFDQDSYMIPGDSPEIREIRRLIKQAKAKIPLNRKNGVYTMRAWSMHDENPSFHRQGK